jgi:hypothetical protein
MATGFGLSNLKKQSLCFATGKLFALWTRFGAKIRMKNKNQHFF